MRAGRVTRRRTIQRIVCQGWNDGRRHAHPQRGRGGLLLDGDSLVSAQAPLAGDTAAKSEGRGSFIWATVETAVRSSKSDGPRGLPIAAAHIPAFDALSHLPAFLPKKGLIQRQGFAGFVEPNTRAPRPTFGAARGRRDTFIQWYTGLDRVTQAKVRAMAPQEALPEPERDKTPADGLTQRGKRLRDRVLRDAALQVATERVFEDLAAGRTAKLDDNEAEAGRRLTPYSLGRPGGEYPLDGLRVAASSGPARSHKAPGGARDPGSGATVP